MAKIKRSKSERFKDDTEKAATKAVAALRELRTCANRARYEWKDEQVSQLIRALHGELDLLQDAFTEAPEQQPLFRYA